MPMLASVLNQPSGVVEVFAGIGSVARGFEGAGFKTFLLTDLDSAACRAYVAHSATNAPYLRCDIRRLTAASLARRLEGQPVAGLLGCPPCQGFSAAGRRLESDPRNRLVSSFFRLLRQLRPRFFVMENVSGLLSYRRFQAELRSISDLYAVSTGILNAALYGLPQTRRRLIVIGYHRDLGVSPTLPLPTHLGSREVFDYGSQSYLSPASKEGLIALGLLEGRSVDWSEELPAHLLATGPKLKNLVRLGDAIGDLPEPVRFAGAPPQSSGRTCTPPLSQGHVLDHIAWNHRREMIRLLREVPEGGVLYGDGVIGRSRRYFSQAYSRLHRDGLARTITTNFHNAGSGRFLHYEQVRTLTVREAARIQGIPDDFSFGVEPSVAERLIGNAFPQPMASAIAAHIHRQIGQV